MRAWHEMIFERCGVMTACERHEIPLTADELHDCMMRERVMRLRGYGRDGTECIAVGRRRWIADSWSEAL